MMDGKWMLVSLKVVTGEIIEQNVSGALLAGVLVLD